MAAPVPSRGASLHSQAVDPLITPEEFFESAKRMDVNGKDEVGDTPLHKIVERIDVPHKELNERFHKFLALLVLGADIEARNNKGVRTYTHANHGKAWTFEWYLRTTKAFTCFEHAVFACFFKEAVEILRSANDSVDLAVAVDKVLAISTLKEIYLAQEFWCYSIRNRTRDLLGAERNLQYPEAWDKALQQQKEALFSFIAKLRYAVSFYESRFKDARELIERIGPIPGSVWAIIYRKYQIGWNKEIANIVAEGLGE